MDIEASDPCELVERRELIAGLRERLAQLPRIQREILLLGAAGYSQAEIARIVGLSERAVRKRITRARRRLGESPA